MSLKATTLLIFFGGWCNAHSQQLFDPEQLDNWRERCRALVAGAYINDYDIIQQNQSRITQYDEQLLLVSRALAQVNGQIKSTQEKFDRNEYSKELTLELQRLKAKRSSLTKQDEELKEVRSKTVAIHAEAKHHLEQLANLIKPVFEKVKDVDARPGSYGFTLQYSASCPKYRAVCPLPDDQAKGLTKIADFLEGSVACRRYAAVR